MNKLKQESFFSYIVMMCCNICCEFSSLGFGYCPLLSISQWPSWNASDILIGLEVGVSFHLVIVH